ncbi:MAG: flagellar biosynthesis protein FlhB [Hyphomonadaceae bacterium]|nr:flagellar biosynthesis protein FlhB [Hyphomonadaceae bacterium]
MAEGADQEDRTEEPTPRKLEEARRKGDIIYTPEVGAALSLFAVAFGVAFLSGPLAGSLGRLLTSFIAAPESFATDPRALQSLAMTLTLRVLGALGLLALAFVLAALAARYVQDKPTFTSEKMKPTIDRLDPIKGFGRVFGQAAFANFLKALAKLTVVGAALAWCLWPHVEALAVLPNLDPAALLPFVKERALELLMTLAAAAALIAGIDYVFTRQSFMKRMRMSREEVKREFREREGDPHVRLRIRQLRAERAKKRMMANVPRASVVVTNPTHYAIALRYEPNEAPAPICLAKGVDEVALRIRELAEEHEIPIVEDPPLARALFASADVDEAIPREHYEAVAKVIGIVLRLAARRRSRGPANRPQ